MKLSFQSMVMARSKATKQSSLNLKKLDCFAQLVIGPAKPDPLARNDELKRSIEAAIDISE